MIISHFRHFIFVRTRKTASTSCEIILSRGAGPNDVITPISPRDERLRSLWGGSAPQNDAGFTNHMAASDIRDLVEVTTWDAYFTFAFDRDPIDKCLSLYFHRYRVHPRPTFDKFVSSGEASHCLNSPIYSDGCEPLVEYLGDYSNVRRDLAMICRHFGLEIGDGTLPRAKGQFRPPGVSGDSVSVNTRRQILENFAEDLRIRSSMSSSPHLSEVLACH